MADELPFFETDPACKTYLPDHWKNTPDEFSAAWFWNFLGETVYIQRVIADLKRYRVTQWKPTLRTELLLGHLCESNLYAREDDICVGHLDLDLNVGSWWDNPSHPTKIVQIELGLVDQTVGTPLLYGRFWPHPKGGGWWWEERDPAEMRFWSLSDWPEYR